MNFMKNGRFDINKPLVSQLNLNRWNTYIQQSSIILKRLVEKIPVPQVVENDIVVDLCSVIPNHGETPNSFYKILMPINKKKIAINLRLSNHNSGAEENWFKHELSGKPNMRISICFGDIDTKPTDVTMSDGIHLYEVQFCSKHLLVPDDRKLIIEAIRGIFINGGVQTATITTNK